MVLLCYLAVLFKHLHGFYGVVTWRQRLHKRGEMQSVRIRKPAQQSRVASAWGITDHEAILQTLTFLEGSQIMRRSCWHWLSWPSRPETEALRPTTLAPCPIDLWLFLEVVNCFRKDQRKYSSRLFQSPPFFPMPMILRPSPHGAVLPVKRTGILNPAWGTWGRTLKSGFLLSSHLWGKQVHTTNFSYI